MEDRDPVGELFSLVEVLRREQHRRAVPGEVPDGLPHLETTLGVEPGRRLIEEDDGRVSDEAHRDVEATAHAARIGRHPPRGRVGQAEALQQAVGDRARVVEMPQPRDQHEVLASGKDLVDRRELAGQADRLPHLRGLRGDIEAADIGAPGVGLEQGGQDVHNRGLARSVGAEQREDGASLHVEFDAAEHVQRLVGLLQATHVDGGPLGLRGCHGFPSSSGYGSRSLLPPSAYGVYDSSSLGMRRILVKP